MKKALHITATLDQPALLEDMVEKLAYRRYDFGYSQTTIPPSLKAIESSSTETYVSGTVGVLDNEDIINMPFITCFLFTCIKEKDESYKLAWSASLS
jgi:hypothetical protein